MNSGYDFIALLDVRFPKSESSPPTMCVLFIPHAIPPIVEKYSQNMLQIN